MKKNEPGNFFKKDDILELQVLIRRKFDWFKKKNISNEQIMQYLLSEFIGSIALCDYSDYFVERTFLSMFEKYKNHPLRKKIEVKKNNV